MKTVPARWYRDPRPQVDGWWLHCLLAASEPAMAAVVETFRDIIMAGPPGPPPAPLPELWNSPPDPLGDFLNGYAVATTGKPWRDMPRRRSPYLRDRLADMPVFRDRDRPLPMTPRAKCSQATAAMLPPAPPRDPGPPSFLAAVAPIGGLALHADDSIPDGVIEIDGTRITLAEMRAACEGP